MPIRRSAAAFGVGVLLLGGLTSCSSHSPKVTITVPTPGQTAPGAAVMGFFQNFVKGSKDACAYVILAEALQCLIAVQDSKATTTDLGIGEITIRGNEALVSVVGKFCVTISQPKSSSCATNSDPRAGQPKHSNQKAFDAAYRLAQQGHSLNKGAVPCQLTNGKWFISLL